MRLSCLQSMLRNFGNGKVGACWQRRQGDTCESAEIFELDDFAVHVASFGIPKKTHAEVFWGHEQAYRSSYECVYANTEKEFQICRTRTMTFVPHGMQTFMEKNRYECR